MCSTLCQKVLAFKVYQMKMNKLLFLSFLFVCIISTSTISASDVDTIKERVLQELMKGEVDDEQIGSLMTSLQKDGTWPDINYEDVSRTGFQHYRHSGYLVLMARAYKTKDSKYYKNKKLKNALELALQNWVDNDYICDNWWHNQIGVPNHLVTVMLIMGDQFPKELVDKAQPIIGRAHIDAPGARPGGDRIKIAGIEAKNMLFLGDGERFDQVVRVIENEIKYVEWVGAKYGYTYRQIKSGFSNRSAGGRGIQYDNSFHHRVDGVNNTLSYGLGYADAFVEWAVYTNGTQYSFSDQKLAQLVDYFLDGICKHAIFGKYPDPGAKNRSFSRPGTLKPYNANTAEKLLETTSHRQTEVKEIADIRNKGIKPTTSHATYYWHSEHFSFQRPDFFTSVRLYSTRTHNMEQPYNSEGLLNHHRGDGTNHISVTGGEYYDIAPVFDYQRVPGTTIMQKPELPSEREIQKIGLTDFVGAATDGNYAAVAFDFRSPHDPLIARKSWFFFDEEYVCLGAGISCRRDQTVVTTLNQCLLRSDVNVSSNSNDEIVDRGQRALEKVDWVHQDGVGYVFPQPTDIHLRNDAQLGSWWRINKQSTMSKEEIEMDVFKLWLDHGQHPSEANYAYIIAPNATVEDLKAQKSKNHIEIISNTSEIQAVWHNELSMVQAVFYKSGEVTLPNGKKVHSENPGILLVKMKSGKITEITAADPNRELVKFRFTISGKIDGSGDHWSARSNSDTDRSEVSIDLPGGVYAGSSVTIVL